VTGTACLLVCATRIGVCADAFSFSGGACKSSCCSAFHSSIVQERRRRGEGTRRSVAGHGPVYSLIHSCAGDTGAFRVKRSCASVAVVSHTTCALSRGFPSLELLPPPCLPCGRSVCAMQRPLIRPLVPKGAKERQRVDKALGRIDP